MSESNIQQPNNEIDLFDLFARLWNVFKRFLTGLKDFSVALVIFLIRKSLWIVIFAAVGVLEGYLIYGLSEAIYTSSLEGNTGGLDNSVVVDHVNKLNKLTEKPQLLASYLNITEEQAKTIRNINAYYGIDVNRDDKPDFIDFKETYNPRDSNQVRVPSYIYLKVAVHDETILPVLRKGLLDYINMNPYLSDLFKINRNQTLLMIQEINNEIHKIDSLQRMRFRNGRHPQSTSMVFMGNESEMKLFYDDVLDLTKQKQKLEKDMDISDEIIVVVQDFTPLSEEENPILHYIVLFGCGMAALGLLVALLWQYRKKICAAIKENSHNQSNL